MSLRELTLMGDVDKVAIAIKRLQAFEPPEGYYLAFSGGKDSQVILHLAIEAGVKFDAHYNLTMDAPELVRFVRRAYPEVFFEVPAKSFWALAKEHKMLPTRVGRWCCDHLKERGGEGRCVVTGIRAAESVKRGRRQIVEPCTKSGVLGKTFVHPILDWSDADVWEFHATRHLPHCSLYDPPYSQRRVGCIMCPFSNDERLEDMRRWPKVGAAYVRTAEWLWENAPGIRAKHESGAAYFDWWIHNRTLPDEAQLDLGVYE
jgi:phosphoadenosine phosphosulfate reductase